MNEKKGVLIYPSYQGQHLNDEFAQELAQAFGEKMIIVPLVNGLVHQELQQYCLEGLVLLGFIVVKGGLPGPFVIA